MGGANIAEYLQEGVEVIFYIEGFTTPNIGMVQKNCTFHNNKFGGDGPPDTPDTTMGLVTKVSGVKCWYPSASPLISIIKLNPTPQQKMLYLLKGAGCLEN